MGRAAALLFASEGARVVGCDLSEQGQQEIQAAGSRRRWRDGIACSLQFDGCATVPRLGRLRGRALRRVSISYYNNAAMAYFNWLEDMTEGEWKNTLNEELNLVFLLTKAAWPHLKASKGVVVNTASVVAWQGVQISSIDRAQHRQGRNHRPDATTGHGRRPTRHPR